ncbi:VWA domain-containing protein [Streptomyces coeruleoprunus]|uniref:VWA domain-containing protein n=1 Tax=Streptomyces coeruleoprunus TaxID=285563 RepID=A0ABV9XCR4_9ACTN
MRLTPPRWTRGALALATGLTVLAMVSPPQAPRLAPTAVTSTAEGADPLDFAVVVDQSKSLPDRDLAREVEAAALLAQGEISERSRATVIGFGSSEKPGQSPVREVCPLTVADAAGRQHLSDCVKQLSRRDPARMGPGTDFPAALRQAVDRLTEKAEGGRPKLVFLLTDGRLDVRDSPEYGTDPAARQANGAKRLTEELARARREKVQIWPLGFGGEIDRAALTAMAEGGYRDGCADRPSARPRMRVVSGAAEIDKALQEVFAAARCAQVGPPAVGRIPADLGVEIPPIATDGSITVSKHDPAVTVTYYDPRGRKVPTQGTFDGSTFELSGQDGPVEALRVKNPLPGRWRAHVEAPKGHQGREVAARVIWQGRLSSTVTLDPASPRPGEQVVVEARMQTRRGVVITDPRQLAGLKVSARMTGDGFAAPLDLALADDGRAPDRTASDVRFTGTVTVPASATGALELTTLMAAPGVTSDKRPLHAWVSEVNPPVKAGLTLDPATVHPGDTVHGTLTVTNNDEAPHTLRLALEDLAPGTRLKISPATVTVEPGKQDSVPFALDFGADVPLGEVAGKVVAVDTTDRGRPLKGLHLNVVVEAPPTWWDRWKAYVVGLAAVVLAVGAVVAVRLRARGRRRDLTGVELELLRDGRPVDRHTIRAGATGGEYRFTVQDARGHAPAVQRARGGASGAHLLRRTGSGELRLRPYGSREQSVRAGEEAGLDDGLSLVVHDRRATTSRAGSAGSGTSRFRPSGFGASGPDASGFGADRFGADQYGADRYGASGSGASRYGSPSPDMTEPGTVRYGEPEPGAPRDPDRSDDGNRPDSGGSWWQRLGLGRRGRDGDRTRGRGGDPADGMGPEQRPWSRPGAGGDDPQGHGGSGGSGERTAGGGHWDPRF